MLTTRELCGILIADDDKDDCFLINKALEESGVKNPVHFLQDGSKLLEHLSENLRTLDAKGLPSLPCLILLDLNMPLMDGRETLKRLKANTDYRKIPVVILSNSKNPDDITTAYREGAASFMTKPDDYQGLVNMMAMLKTYWFQTVQLPLKSLPQG